MTEEIKRILDYLINEKAYLHYGIRREKFIELEGKEVKTLLDYITNLQQENEKLKYNARGQVNDYFKDKYADEVLKNAELKKENETLKAKLEIGKTCGFCPYYDYKSRCKKAIEYIKSTNCYGMRSGKTLLQKYLYDLLNILNDGDKNETNS